MTYTVKCSQDTVKFHKKYYENIKNGSKTQTMRIARKRWDVQEGDIVTAVFPGIDETLDIRINVIGYKQLKSLIMEDAILEGYESIADLKNELTRIYPTINKWDRLYYYRFEVVA